jgi:hypothetical protein
MTELTVSDGARESGVHQNNLTRLLVAGRLRARKDKNGRWLIDRTSFDQWNATRKRRPPETETPVPSLVRLLGGSRPVNRKRDKGTEVEHMKRPATGTAIPALRPREDPSRPGNDVWKTNTIEVKK